MSTRYGTRLYIRSGAADAAEAASSAGMSWDGTDLAIVGNLKIGSEKVIKFDNAESVTMGFEAASGDVEFNGADLDVNNASVLQNAAPPASATASTIIEMSLFI